MNDFKVSVLTGVFIASVIGLSALYQHVQFRRTGDPPVWTLRHVFLFGGSAFVSSALGEFWNPPLWQKLLLVCAGIAVVFGLIEVLRKRGHPYAARLAVKPRKSTDEARPTYAAGRAAARWFMRVVGKR